MRPNDPRGATHRRRRRLAIESLEIRHLPSSLGPNLPGRHIPAADVQQFVPVLYPPNTPQPTAAEIARESYVGKAIGEYTIGPGRFGSQSLTIHGFGKSAGSNQSQHARFSYGLFTPSPSAASPSLSGIFQFLVKDFTASGASLIVNFQGPVNSQTTTNVNGLTLPTRSYWVLSPTSGTTYTGTGFGILSSDPAIGATYSNFSPGTNNNYFDNTGTPRIFDQMAGQNVLPPGAPGGPAPTSVDNWAKGFGDITFKYIPNQHPARGTMGSGTVIVVLRGLINYSGAQNSPDKNFM